MEEMNKNRQNAIKYKWCAILSSCVAIFIAYAKEWITIPETIVSALKIGDDLLGLEDYISSDLNGVKEALLQGKLTLLQTQKGLSVLGEFMTGEDAANYSTLLKIFYGLILFFLAMEVAEILWYFFDKRKPFLGSVISGTVLFGVVFWFVMKTNQELEMEGESRINVSIWAWICLALPFVSCFLWHQYRKYAVQETQYASTEAAVTEGNEVSKVVAFSKEKASSGDPEAYTQIAKKITELDWKEFFNKNKRIVLFTIVAILFPIIERKIFNTEYSSSSIFMWRVETIAEAMVIGLLIIYIRANRYEYLIVYASISVLSKMAFYERAMRYYSLGQYVSNIWYPIVIIAFLYFSEKVLQENKTKWYMMAGLVAALRAIGVPWIGQYYITLDLEKVLWFVGIFGVVYIYLSKTENFMKITDCSDEKIMWMQK